jgi:hypothetical protein
MAAAYRSRSPQKFYITIVRARIPLQKRAHSLHKAALRIFAALYLEALHRKI